MPRFPVRHRSLLFAAVLVLGLAVFAELWSRAYLQLRYGHGAWRPGDAIHHFYPGLGAYERGDEGPRPDAYDVLLLGGSVLDQVASAIAPALQQRLGRPVRVHDFASPAHTSLDSLYKLRALRHLPFDQIVFYHGINEARANNVPAGEFRDDYSHYAWYEELNAVVREHEKGTRLTTAIPLAARLVALQVARLTGVKWTLPRHRTPRALTEHGREIKTAATFERNLDEILRIAREQRIPVVLMTFAYYLPADYTRRAFLDGKLDYTPDDDALPINIWGKPKNVVAAIDRHNHVIARLARDHPEVVLVDQRASMPASGEFFIDACHLSETGIAAFVTRYADAVARAHAQGRLP